MYTQLERTSGWKDLQARMVRVRDDYTREIVNGTLDKFGNNRDNEKRAALMVIERILSFYPAVVAQYKDLTKRKDEQTRKAQRRTEGGLHGDDVVNINTGAR